MTTSAGTAVAQLPVMKKGKCHPNALIPRAGGLFHLGLLFMLLVSAACATNPVTGKK